MAKKKTTKTPDGISYKRTSTGINVTVAENGRKLTTMRGYNNTQNMQKGLRALREELDRRYNTITGKFDVTDLTPKKKG